jgi:hypothetical protein
VGSTLKLPHKNLRVPQETVQPVSRDAQEEAYRSTGLPPNEMKLLFRGREKEDREPLVLSGVKNGSQIKVAETQEHVQKRAAELAAQGVLPPKQPPVTPCCPMPPPARTPCARPPPLLLPLVLMAGNI